MRRTILTTSSWRRREGREGRRNSERKVGKNKKEWRESRSRTPKKGSIARTVYFLMYVTAG
jgi:hypothetical protein